MVLHWQAIEHCCTLFQRKHCPTWIFFRRHVRWKQYVNVRKRQLITDGNCVYIRSYMSLKFTANLARSSRVLKTQSDHT